MTRELAKKVINAIIDKQWKKLSSVEFEALQMAIADMEKQIPKKILYIEQSYGTPWLCPECESGQIKVEFFCTDGSKPKEKVSYCWKCGQALDWSDNIEN